MSSRVGRVIRIVLTGAFVIGCGSDGTGPTSVATPVPTVIAVEPASAVLVALGSAQRFTATVLDQGGYPMSGVPVVWRSSDAEVASVATEAGDGVLTATGNGEATLTATAAGVSGSASITVQQAPAVMDAVAGDGQIGWDGLQLPEQPAVRVTDTNGQPVAGIEVRFVVVVGTGTLTHPTAVTGSDGEAATHWTLGSELGVQSIEATAGTLSVRFDAFGEPPPGPRVGFDRATLSYKAPPGGPDPVSQTVLIRNDGSGVLTGLDVGVEYAAGGPRGWVDAALGGSAAPTPLTIAVRSAGIGAGVHTAEVMVGSSDLETAPNAVVVTLVVPSGQPAPPSGLAALSPTDTAVDLSWQDASANETEFRVERSEDAGTEWATLAALPADSTRYGDTGLGVGATVLYRVRACNASGCSRPSDVATATVGAGGDAPLVRILEPRPGARFEPGETIRFRASAVDPQSGALGGADVVWGYTAYDLLDETMGNDTTLLQSTMALPAGEYTITLQATDPDGNRSSVATIPIELMDALGRAVEPGPPVVLEKRDDGLVLRYELSGLHALTEHWLEWGPTSELGLETPHELGVPDCCEDYGATLVGLLPGTVVHYRVRARNVYGIATGPLRSQSTAETIAITTPDTLPTGIAGRPYGPVQLGATGGDPDAPELEWSDPEAVLAGMGLALSGSGEITGTPSVDTVVSFPVEVDSRSEACCGAPTTKRLTLSVAGSLARVDVTPSQATLAVGERQILTAYALDDAGDTIRGVPVTWSSSRPGVASVTPDGSIVGLGVGSTDVSATVAGLTSAPAGVRVVVPQLNAGARVTGLSAQAGVHRVYKIQVPAGTGELLVGTSAGSGNVDLLLRHGQAPSLASPSSSDCTSKRSGTGEWCEILNPAGGDWYVMLASVAGYSGVSIESRLRSGGPRFHVDVNTGSLSGSQRQLLNQAVARWAALLPADLSGFPVTNPCGRPNGSTLVDDLVIFAEVAPIDGVGGAVAQAGPCMWRSGASPNPVLPLAGVIVVDQADLAGLEASGLLLPVLLHELGHVLGFGTLWPHARPKLIQGVGTADPYFSGSRARTAFSAAGGAGYTGNAVPVESTGSGGTPGNHWRESVFGSELMTGFLEAPGVAMPLSAVTLQAFADLGYTVSAAGADGFSLSGSASVGAQTTGGGGPMNNDLYLGALYTIDAEGVVRVMGGGGG